MQGHGTGSYSSYGHHPASWFEQVTLFRRIDLKRRSSLEWISINGFQSNGNNEHERNRRFRIRVTPFPTETSPQERYAQYFMLINIFLHPVYYFPFHSVETTLDLSF